jgi:hypothetical protein
MCPYYLYNESYFENSWDLVNTDNCLQTHVTAFPYIVHQTRSVANSAMVKWTVVEARMKPAVLVGNDCHNVDIKTKFSLIYYRCIVLGLIKFS